MTTKKENWSERRSIIAGLIGNMLEWYDFGVYGFFASIIAMKFFPSADPTTSLIASFGAFAAGFLMRPVGGAIFGHIGDRYGRGRALQLSVLCMAVPTFLIGLLPTYQSIGTSAAVLMVLMRMLQGTAVGGEYTSSIVFLAERAKPGKRAFFTCWSMFGAMGGILLGSLVGAFLSSILSVQALSDWGWRVAFMGGIIVSITGYFIRRGLVEKPLDKLDKAPLIEAFKNHGKSIFKVVGINVIHAVTFYLMFIFSATWLIKNVGKTRSDAMLVNTASMVLLLIMLPVFAKLSDAWGRKKVLLLGIGGIALAAYPLLKLMHHTEIYMIIIGQMGFAILLACLASAIPAIMVEMFPGNIRVTAVSVSYNIAFAIFGGTSPMIAVWLIERTKNDLSFAWYISLAAVISFLFSLTLKDRRNEPLT